MADTATKRMGRTAGRGILMAKTLLFDTWGTLVDNYSIADVIEQYVFESHIAQNVAQDWRFQHKWAMFHLTLSDNFVPHPGLNEACLRWALDFHNVTLSDEEIKEINGQYHKLRAYPDVVGALKDLKDQGYVIKFVANPYNCDESEFGCIDSVAVVPPLNPDVAILHAQRADADGNTQLWGLLGAQKEAAFAAERVIVVVEEIVDTAVVRSDSNRTVVPGLLVDALVHQPYGAHPSYTQGYYDRDNQFYRRWDEVSRDEESTLGWLREWVYGVDGWTDYLAKLESEQPGIWERLTPREALAYPVNYGMYA